MTGQSTTAILAAAMLFSGVDASACQMTWKTPSEPHLTSISAHLVTTSGQKVNCKVTDYYLPEPAFRLACANGSIVEIGRSPFCGRGPQEWPHCDYGLLLDRSKQSFKLQEDAYPLLTMCAQGLARTIFGYRLSQTTFSFEAFIEVAGPQQSAKRPVGF